MPKAWTQSTFNFFLAMKVFFSKVPDSFTNCGRGLPISCVGSLVHARALALAAKPSYFGGSFTSTTLRSTRESGYIIVAAYQRRRWEDGSKCSGARAVCAAVVQETFCRNYWFYLEILVKMQLLKPDETILFQTMNKCKIQQIC